MMKLEILEEFSGSNDQMVVKRKRTKRPRPSSSTSSNGGGCGGGYYNSLVSSPATSSGISTTTEEDEDMANCLILLARGNSPPQLQETKPPPPPAEEENKFSSRKFTEMATTTDGKVGIYVYECKTCNRTFSSFQALGGHRASHKKPKTTADEDHNRSLTTAAAPDNQEKGQFPPTPSTQLVSIICNNDPNKPKIHECAICGSEFASGQALGGHMRRHRPAPSTSTRIGTPDNDTSSHDVGEKPRTMFALDLNLPAPTEDNKFQQFPAKQSRVLSSPPRHWWIATIR